MIVLEIMLLASFKQIQIVFVLLVGEICHNYSVEFYLHRRVNTFFFENSGK